MISVVEPPCLDIFILYIFFETCSNFSIRQTALEEEVEILRKSVDNLQSRQRMVILMLIDACPYLSEIEVVSDFFQN